MYCVLLVCSLFTYHITCMMSNIYNRYVLIIYVMYYASDITCK